MIKVIKKSKILIFALVFLITNNVYADLQVPSFNGIDPQTHINKIYSNERKEELKKNIITYDNISDMIHLFNPDILNNWNSWENNKSGQDIYNDYQDAASALEGGGGDSEIQDAMTKAQASAMRIQADKNIDDSYTNFLKFYKEEKNLVLNTKVLYLEYLKSEFDLKVASENCLEFERKEETAKKNYEVGTGTYIDLLQSRKALTDAKSAEVIAKSNQNTYKRNLLINCGRSMYDNINIVNPNIDYTMEIIAINLADDIDKALKNNIQYEIYKRNKELAQTEEVKNEIEINLNAVNEKIFNDLENKYSNLVDTVNTFHDKEAALKLSKENLVKSKNEYNHGNISKKEYMNSESALKISEYNLESSKYDMWIAYEKYVASVDGLANC